MLVTLDFPFVPDAVPDTVDGRDETRRRNRNGKIKTPRLCLLAGAVRASISRLFPASSRTYLCLSALPWVVEVAGRQPERCGGRGCVLACDPCDCWVALLPCQLNDSMLTLHVDPNGPMTSLGPFPRRALRDLGGEALAPGDFA